MSDYKKALLLTQYLRWDDLIILMVQTKDQILSKKIERFLHAYKFEYDYPVIEKYLIKLLDYIDFADKEIFSIQAITSNN